MTTPLLDVVGGSVGVIAIGWYLRHKWWAWHVRREIDRLKKEANR